MSEIILMDDSEMLASCHISTTTMNLDNSQKNYTVTTKASISLYFQTQ